MGYKVTGAAAVVEFDDDNEELNTGRKVYLEQNAPVPEGVKQACIEHLLAVGLIAETADGEKPKRGRGAKAETDDGE